MSDAYVAEDAMVAASLVMRARLDTAQAAAESAASVATDLAVSARSHGVAGDGVTDDTAALQSAIDATPEGGTLWLSPGVFATSDTLTFGRINVKMGLSSYIEYGGTGTAVILDTPGNCEVDISVRRTSRAWDATDTTSRGIVLKNGRRVRLTCDVRYFNAGLVMQGDGAGCVYNDVNVTAYDNKTGLLFEVSNAGWANQNEIHGQIAYFSGAASYVGTRMIDLSVGNNNTFIGVSLEGASHERSIYCATNYNMFLNCRYEANVNGSIELTSTSQFNYIVGGYGMIGSSLIVDAGNWNTVIAGAYVRHAFGQGSNTRGMVLATDAANATVLTVAEADGDETRMDVASDGSMCWYIGTGKEANATPLLDLRGGTGSAGGIRFGHTSTAAVGQIYAHNTSYLALVGHLLWPTDNTYDLGTATQRLRDLFVGRNVRVNGHVQMGSATTGPRLMYGTGSPEGAVAAPVGSIFMRDDGGSGTTMYVKESGTSNTGWVAK